MRWKFWDHDHCPRCNHKENTKHVILCQLADAKSEWERLLHQYSQWLTEENTNPHIIKAIIHGLKSLHINSAPLTDIDASVQEVYMQQSKIGWYFFILGFPSKYWAKIQHQYFCNLLYHHLD